jgi:Cu/Ag efflux protein CusF
MAISRIRCVVVVAALILSGTAACRTGGPEQRYELQGKVIQVDKKGLTVTISHEAIRGYMDAMTMPFKLKDERLLKDLAEGDSVQATLVVAGLRSWLEDVVVTRETVDPSNLGKPETWVEPKPGDEVPDFKLEDQNNKRISFQQYRGRIVVLTFIYTRCPLPDYCPLMTDNFAEIEPVETESCRMALSISARPALPLSASDADVPAMVLTSVMVISNSWLVAEISLAAAAISAVDAVKPFMVESCSLLVAEISVAVDISVTEACFTRAMSELKLSVMVLIAPRSALVSSFPVASTPWLKSPLATSLAAVTPS